MEREKLAGMLKVLGDPTRLSIFDTLMEGVQCNCEISARLGLSYSLISHHLHVLHDAGLVSWEHDEQDARWIYYSVDRGALERLKQAVDALLDADRIQPREPCCGPGACSSAG